MPRPHPLIVLVTALCALIPLPGLLAAAPDPTAPVDAATRDREVAFFESRIRPLLEKRCVACHSQKIAQGGLRLDDPAFIRRGGDGGALFKPGQPDASRLIEAVNFGTPKLQMPPAGKLPQAEIDLLRQWVERGAHLPAPRQVGVAVARPLTLEEGRAFWSIRPLRAVDPRPGLRGWSLKRVDDFILARLERAGIRPSPAADRATLLRRVSLDLTGLPPTPEEIDAFLTDNQPGAYERVVDRLLASPHYGERWARHWLDLVRYCDVPEAWGQMDAQAWRYRDWVVGAMNQDVPYNRFVALQLAADQIPDATTSDLAALGMMGLSPTYWKELKLAPDVIKTVVSEEWEERINTLSGALMALTVACARCHDHKNDAITARDYYGLAGVFASIRQVARPMLPPDDAGRVVAARAEVKRLTEQATEKENQAKGQAAMAAALRGEAAELRKQADRIRAETPGFDAPTVYAVEDASLHVLPDGEDRTRLDYRPGQAQDVRMQVRGNVTREGDVVPRGLPALLTGREPVRFTQGSGRRELAESLFRDGAPLAARVIVNRVWMHHFGRGLVATPSNFGATGDRPTHPELLDDLSIRFIASGWSMKWLHREIVLSATYRQAGGAAPRPLTPTSKVAADPSNTLYWKMSRRRLEVEAWRDSILRASGSLDLTLGGEPRELTEAGFHRRTLYGRVTRRDLNDLLRLYDFPDPSTHSPARFPTTTPLQQLFILNSPFITAQARALVQRVHAASPETAARVQLAHRLLYGRAATPDEVRAADEFVAVDNPTDSAARWQEYAEVLLSRNELMYAD